MYSLAPARKMAMEVSKMAQTKKFEKYQSPRRNVKMCQPTLETRHRKLVAILHSQHKMIFYTSFNRSRCHDISRFPLKRAWATCNVPCHGHSVLSRSKRKHLQLSPQTCKGKREWFATHSGKTNCSKEAVTWTWRWWICPRIY